MTTFDPAAAHDRMMREAALDLAYSGQADFDAWRRQLRGCLETVVGDMPARVAPEPRWGEPAAHEGFTERRLVFTSEPGVDVPCVLVVPRTGSGPFPLMICLQGHTSGMHISLGRVQHPRDEASLGGDRDFAVQAVARGFAALALEQRCFGERMDGRPEDVRGLHHTCLHAAMVSLLLGRTMIGERVWDVSRAIDVVSELDEIDAARIACMGNSSGGTITYYAACLEPRIAAAMPSCSVRSYPGAIGSIDHCPDTYLPGALRHFDMGDLAGLIAPRPLVVVAGRTDPISPFASVEQAMDTIRRVYRAAGGGDRCRLVVGEGGHRFYVRAWEDFRSVTGWW